MNMKRCGMLVVVSGPSGAGKGTICRALLKRLPDITFSVSATTRKVRAEEQPGTHYAFVEEPVFRRMIEEDAFLEWAEVYGNLYGTPRLEVENLLAEGYDVLLDIDTQGAMQVRQKFPEAVFVFLAAPSLKDLEVRLKERGTETRESLDRRLREASEHMRCIDRYDYIVINDNLENAVEEVYAIIIAERCRVIRQHPGHLQRLIDSERGWGDC